MPRKVLRPMLVKTDSARSETEDTMRRIVLAALALVAGVLSANGVVLLDVED